MWVPPGAIAQDEGAATQRIEATLNTQGAFTLRRCVEFALQHSRSLRDARLDLDVAGAQVREAWSAVMPQIDASASLTRNITDQTAFFPAIFFNPEAGPNDFVNVKFVGDNLWNTTLTLEQPLFQADAFVGLGAASRFRSLQEERLRGSTQALVTDVRTFYYRALLDRENVRLLRESIRRIEQTLNGARGLEAAGLGSSYDVLRLEVELAKLQPNLQRALNILGETERDLRIAMGLDMDEPLALIGALNTMDLEDMQANTRENRELLRAAGVTAQSLEDLDRLLELSEARRSELVQARLDTHLARAQLSAERATVYPKLTMFVNYRIDAQENGSLDFFGSTEQERSDNLQAGVRLEVPVWQGGARYSRMAQRGFQVRQREQREELSEQRAHDEIRTRLLQLLEARQRARAQKGTIGQAQRGFDIASAEFRNGLGTQINATDAEVSLREAEFNYAQAVFDVLNYQAQLDAAVGIVPLVDEIGTASTAPTEGGS
jgi:outer membrane protein TolC